MRRIQKKLQHHTLALLIMAAAVSFFTPRTQAALSVSNGDFEADAVQTSDVAQWYDTIGATPANWWEATWAGPNVSPNGTSVLGLSYMFGSVNWAYQSIGVNDAAQSSIVINYDVGSFTDAGAARDLGVTFSIYESDGSFVPSNTVDIATGGGITLIDSITVLSGSLNPGQISTDRAVQLDLSSASTTGELFLHIQNALGGVGEPWVAIDNVSLSESLPPFIISGSPTGTGVANPVTLQAVVEDFGSQFDSVEMYLDGSPVTPDSIDTVSGITTISFAAAALESSTLHTGKVVVAGVDPTGFATNEWTFTMAEALTFVSGTPAGIGASQNPTLQAVIDDLNSQLDTGSIELSLDGNGITPDAIDSGSGTTTISYYQPTALDPGSKHTAQVVYSGINPAAGPFTNSWTFTVEGDPGFGIYIGETSAPTPGAEDVYQFVAAQTDSNNCNTVFDGGAGDVGTQNDGSTYVALDRDNSQGQLFTTGLGPSYELTSVWVKHVGYSGVYGNGTYANLTVGHEITLRIVDPAQADTAGFELRNEVLTVVSNSISSAGTAGTGKWIELRLENPVTLDAATQYGFDLTINNSAYLELAGINTNAYGGGSAYTTAAGEDPNTGTLQTGDRTFLVALTKGSATVTPDLQSIEVAGGAATLTWISEYGVNYNVLSTENLVYGPWTSVSNVSGAGESTMVVLPASAHRTFYKIEGN